MPYKRNKKRIRIRWNKIKNKKNLPCNNKTVYQTLYTNTWNISNKYEKKITSWYTKKICLKHKNWIENTY